MRKHVMHILLIALTACLFTGCGKKEEATAAPAEDFSTEEEILAEETETAAAEEPEEEEIAPEGMYRSELTNEWIDESLKNQRPIAVMVDNEIKALPHYGLSKADIVYELMNSTANGQITRFMVLFKDYESIEQIGSVRSVRPTNLMLAPEWNAIICHDGGPFYCHSYYNNDYVDHFSGTFSRVDNGKTREYTEYILSGDIETNFKNSNVDREYNEYQPKEPHFKFTSENKPVTFEGFQEYFDCTLIDLPFPHNNSQLDYDEASKTYLYSEYGSAHLDPGNNSQQLAFKNVILQKMSYSQLDSAGYLVWNCIGAGNSGYYITEGKAIPITWSKVSETDRTIYYDMFGQEIVLNTGKTYIGFVADTLWDTLVVE